MTYGTHGTPGTPAGPLHVQTDNRLFASLNGLVVDGTLTPHQADQVYRAVASTGPHASAAPGATDAGASGWNRQRLLAALGVLGAGLLATAYIVAASVDSEQDFGWKTTVLMAGVTVVLAAGAAVAYAQLRHRAWAPWLAGVLGALALAAFAFALVVLWDPEGLIYLAGALMLLGGVAGFWSFGGQLFAVVAVVGGGVLLGQVFSDSLSGGGDGGSGDVLTVGLGFLLYGVAVAAAGWRFSCRRLLGVIGLGLAVVSMLVVIYLETVLFSLVVAFGDGPGRPDRSSLHADIRTAMALGLGAAVLATLAHAWTAYSGFAVVAFSGAALLPVSAIAALNGQHPLRWAITFAVVGTVGVAAALLTQLDRNGPAAAPAGQPLTPDDPMDPHADVIRYGR